MIESLKKLGEQEAQDVLSYVAMGLLPNPGLKALVEPE